MTSNTKTLVRWKTKLAFRLRRRLYVQRQVAYWTKRVAIHRKHREPEKLKHAESMLGERKLKLTRALQDERFARRVVFRHRRQPLRIRAFEIARAYAKAGVVEQGGNNRGRAVEAIIKLAGGRPGDAWCGWFVAACYRRAGSTLPDWRWGSVRLYLQARGLGTTIDPRCGDIVRFTFDHMGMFWHWCNADGSLVPRSEATHILTIEGNTGSTGAVSDSANGQDGVKVKVRHRSLVQDYLRVAG